MNKAQQAQEERDRILQFEEQFEVSGELADMISGIEMLTNAAQKMGPVIDRFKIEITLVEHRKLRNELKETMLKYGFLIPK